MLIALCAGCESVPDSAGDASITAPGPLGKLAGVPLPPKGQAGVTASSWIVRAGAPGVLEQLAISGESLPGPDGAWAASGLKVFRVSTQIWAAIESAFVRPPVVVPVNDGELPRPVDVNLPSAIIGPRTWIPDGAEWAELARGSPMAAGQVLALHDGRFAAPASTPRLLARAFLVWGGPGAAEQSDGSGGLTVVELVPQLLGLRRPDADLDLMSPKLANQWSRGQVLDRLLGAVTLEAGQVLVITTATGGDVAPSIEPETPDADVTSKPGRMRGGSAAPVASRRGLGPPVGGPDGLGMGNPFGAGASGAGGTSAGNMPPEERAVPTIGEAILAARAGGEESVKGRPLGIARSFVVLRAEVGSSATLSKSQVAK